MASQVTVLEHSRHSPGLLTMIMKDVPHEALNDAAEMLGQDWETAAVFAATRMQDDTICLVWARGL